MPYNKDGSITWTGEDIRKGLVPLAPDVKQYNLTSNDYYRNSADAQTAQANKATQSSTSLWDDMKRKLVFGNNSWDDAAANVAKGLNINPDILIGADHDTIEKAKQLYTEKQQMQDIKAFENKYPELAQMNFKNKSEALQLLNHASDVYHTRGLWDAFQQGLWSSNDQQKLGRTAYELSQTTDESKKTELKKEIERLQKNLSQYRTPGTIGQTIMHDSTAALQQTGSNMLYGATRASQGAAMGMGVGAVAGASAGGVGALPGAIGGFLVGAEKGWEVGMGEDMQHVSYGLKYLDLLNKKNAQGKAIYSEQEASNRALAYSVVDAGIEFAATKLMMKGAKLVPGSSAIAKVLSHESADVVTQNIAKRTAQYAWQGAKGSVKAIVPEVVEEGLQDINEKVQTDMFGKEGDDHYTLGDIAKGAGQAMWQALPAMAGFGLLGGLGHVRHRWARDRALSRLTATMQSVSVDHENVSRGNELLTGLMEEANTNKLAKVNPELFGKVIQKTADVKGVGNVYLHVNEALRSEEGLQMLDHLVEKGVLSEEDIKHSIENDVPVEVPIGSFAQTAGIDEQAQQTLKKVVSYDQEGRSLIGVEDAMKDIEKAKFDALAMEAQQKRVSEAKDKMIDTPNHHEVKDMIAPIVQDMDSNNASDAVPLMEQSMEEYAQAMTSAHQDLVGIAESIESPEDRQAWMQSIQDEGRMPNAVDMAIHASDVIRNNLDKLPMMDAKGEARAKDFMEVGDVLRDAQSARNELSEFADNYDIYTTLSHEGMKVYDHVSRVLTSTYSTDVSKQQALLFAAHADTYAYIMNQAGDPDFTALDYYEMVAIEHGGEPQEGYAQLASVATTEDNLRKGLITNEVDNLGGDVVVIPNGDTVIGDGAYAVVPRDTDRELTASLREKGMKIVKFDKDVEGSKDRAIAQAQARATMFQTAYHGTSATFDRFDIGKIGDGTGDSIHGWGLYFAKNKETAKHYRKLLQDATGEKGNLFKVDVPEDTDLLHEDYLYNDQPKTIKDKLDKAMKDLPQKEREALAQEFIRATGYSPNSKAYDEIEEHINDGLDVEVRLNKAIDGKASKIVQRNITRGLQDLGIIEDNTINFDDKEELIAYRDQVRKVMDEWSKEQDLLVDRENPINPISVNENPAIIAGKLSGDQIYTLLAKVLGGEKNASLYLNSHGIKGIKYADLTDGDCFVVFDDKAVDIITTFNQKHNDIRGLTSFYDSGKRLIQLFEIANESTFIHECGHLFLEDLHRLATMEGAPTQIKEDWDTIKEWTGYNEDGTMESNRDAHEKFAQGFEAYTREGKAPSKMLERAFNNFRKWLVQIYQEVTHLGGNPPQAIKDVMDRMLATHDAMERYATEQRIGAMTDTEIVQTMNESSQATLMAKINEAKDSVETELIGDQLQGLKNAVAQEWVTVRDDVIQNCKKELMEAYPIYKISYAFDVYGDAALAHTPYNTVSELAEAEEREGIGDWNEVIADTEEKAKQAFFDAELDPAHLQEKLEKYSLTHGVAEQATLAELNAIKDGASQEVSRLYDDWTKARTATGTDEEVANTLLEMQTVPEDVKKDVADNPGKAKGVMKEQAKRIQYSINRLEDLKQVSVGTIKDYKQQAIEELGALKVSQATSYKTFQNRAVTEGRKCDVCLADNDLVDAMYHKQKQLLYLAKARIAFDNKTEAEKIEKNLKRKHKSITRPKNPARIEPNARYFIGHLMYQLGIVNNDVIEPVDGFDMSAVHKLLDIDAELMGDDAAVQNVIDGFISNAFQNGANWKRDFTMDEIRDINTLVTALYTQGKNIYEGTTLIDANGEQVTFDKAVDEMYAQFMDNEGLTENKELPLNRENAKGAIAKIKDKIGNYALSLVKVETILRRLDSFADDKYPNEYGAFMRYIYAPIDRATMKGKEMLADATRNLSKAMKVYSSVELHKIRNERKYTVGFIHNMTKEQVLAIALNMGTEASRQRVLETCKVDDIAIIENDLANILTDKDWDWVESIWTLINSYYEDRSAVQERLYGVPLAKEKGVTFTVGGREIEGQYYPIKYDPRMNGKAKEYEVEDIIKSQMSSNAVWGLGMGSTKSRMAVVKDKSLLLSLDVIPQAIDEAINHIAMREAVTDVNRLINHREFSEMISNTLGTETLQLMKEWVRDNWQAEINKTDAMDKFWNRVKAHSTFAVMAYRTSTAALNVLNIFPAMGEHGVLPTLLAIKSFYGNPTNYKANRDFVMARSIFMAERIHTLDADLAQGLSIGGDGIEYTDARGEQVSNAKRRLDAVNDAVSRYAYYFITETDLMISMPIWKQAYEKAYTDKMGAVYEAQAKASKEFMDGEEVEVPIDESWANREAVLAADKAVRRVFGSGDAKDSVRMQKHGKIVPIFTPFYTYSNTVLNALMGGYYKSIDTKTAMPLIKSMLFWVIIQGIAEGLLRALWDNDDDDFESLSKKALSSVVGGAVQGLPIYRDIAGFIMSKAMGDKPSSGSSPVMLSVVDKVEDFVNVMGNEHKDWVDAGRAGTEVLNRTGLIRFGDTATDGFWTLMRVLVSDTDATLSEVLTSLAFDKRVKTKEEKRKDKRKQNKKKDK